jgi:hypothetical protein
MSIDLIAAEQAAIAAGADACYASCACHGNILCLRAAHDHDVDQAVPHLGYDADGQLVQWIHTDEHGPALTADEIAEQAAAARREHTRQILTGLDLDELRAALAAP